MISVSVVAMQLLNANKMDFILKITRLSLVLLFFLRTSLD